MFLECFTISSSPIYVLPLDHLCIFPFFIMAIVFEIQMTINAARKLCVTGESIYTSPYIWLILFIIPVFGWILFIVMYLYLNIWIVIKLYEGKGEINI